MSYLIISTIIIIFLGVLSIKKNEVKDKLIKENKISEKNYQKLTIFSCFLGLILSFLSYKIKGPSILNVLYGLIFTISPIAIFEDFKSFTVNRHTLRVAYLSVLIASPLYTKNKNTLILIGIISVVYILFLLFGGKNFGPSDARMLLTVTPISLMIFKDNVILGLLAPLIMSFFYQLSMMIFKRKVRVPVPLAPPIMGYISVALIIFLI